MDAKITKIRLSRMLSYDWIKIIGAAAAAIIVWMLIFTMTATRILPSQEFVVCNYTSNIALTNDFYANYQKIGGQALSKDVLNVRADDMTTAAESAYQLLQARVATEELDVMLVSQEWDVSTAIPTDSTSENSTPQYKNTYLQSFVRSYSYALHDVEKLLSDMETFVGKYYTGDVMNAQKVEEDFRARALRMKDKRYKKEADILTGVELEKDRIAKYREALLSMKGYIEKGYVTLTHTEYKDETGKAVISGKYSFNICPTTVTDTAVKAKLDKLSKMVGYTKKYLDENGKEQTTVSADNMNVCLFDIDTTGEEVYDYEGILYINGLVSDLLKA